MEEPKPAANNPPSKVEVPAKVERIPDPVIRSPEERLADVADIPPAKVAVETEVILSVPEDTILPPVIVRPRLEPKPAA